MSQDLAVKEKGSDCMLFRRLSYCSEAKATDTKKVAEVYYDIFAAAQTSFGFVDSAECGEEPSFFSFFLPVVPLKTCSKS